MLNSSFTFLHTHLHLSILLNTEGSFLCIQYSSTARALELGNVKLALQKNNHAKASSSWVNQRDKVA